MINFMFRMWVLEACTALFSLIVLASLITAAVTNAEIIIRVKIISRSSNNDQANNSDNRQQLISQRSGPDNQHQQQQQGNNDISHTTTNANANARNDHNRCSRTCTIVRIGEDFLVTLLTAAVGFYFMLVLSEIVYIPKPSHIFADTVYMPKLSQIVEFVVMRI